MDWLSDDLSTIHFFQYRLNLIIYQFQNQIFNMVTFNHIDDTSTLTRWAPILKLLSNHDLSHTAAWAGQEANGRPKQLYGTNHG